MNLRPLCTAIVCPTMSGTMVDRRDHVLITFRSRVEFNSATFLTRWSSVNAPFLIDRAIFLRLRLATADDERIRPLVVSGLHSLRLPAPRRRGVAPAGRLAFAAAHRMVDRIHRDAAHVGTATDPAIASGLADRHVLVLDVSDLADGRVTLDVDLADLPGRKTDLGVAPLFRHELRGGAGGSDELAAAAPLQLQVVDRRAERDPSQGERVTRQDVRRRSGDHLRADLESVRREDVALLSVGVVE